MDNICITTVQTVKAELPLHHNLMVEYHIGTNFCGMYISQLKNLDVMCD